MAIWVWKKDVRRPQKKKPKTQESAAVVTSLLTNK